jgi:hypothetical protein
MEQFSASVRADYYDYNKTSTCLQYGLDRQYKQMCKNITGMSPNTAGAMMFFQVHKIVRFVEPFAGCASATLLRARVNDWYADEKRYIYRSIWFITIRRL